MWPKVCGHELTGILTLQHTQNHQQFGEGPLLFQQHNTSVHKARSVEEGFSEFGMEELD